MGTCASTAWSFSRHKSLRGCPRSHWFAYYRKGEPDAVSCLAHSRLVTRHMMVGQVADTVAGLVLNHVRRAGKVPAPEKVERVAREYAAKSIASSQRGAQLVLAGKVPYFGAQVLNDQVWGTEPLLTDEQVEEKVAQAAVAFASSGVVSRLLSAPVESWPQPRRREDPRPEAWRLGENWVSSAPDSWIEEQGRFVLLDWKASRFLGPDDGLQLAVYGLWAVHSRGWDPSRVYHQVVLMPTCPDFEPQPVSESSMAIASEVIAEDCARERSMVEAETNRRGDLVYVAERERFPARPERAVCASCKFRALCPEGQASLEQKGPSGP